MGSFLKKYSLTILTLTISILTLFVYVRQTSLLTKQTSILIQQTKASSWPYLSIVPNYEKTEDGGYSKYEILVVNNGTGPAIIEKVVVRLNGKEYLNWDDFYSILPTGFKQGQTKSHTLYQQVLKPGDIYTLVGWNKNMDVASYLLEHGILSDLEIAICYKSFFDEYWTITTKGFSLEKHPQIERIQSDECQLQANTYFIE